MRPCRSRGGDLWILEYPTAHTCSHNEYKQKRQGKRVRGVPPRVWMKKVIGPLPPSHVRAIHSPPHDPSPEPSRRVVPCLERGPETAQKVYCARRSPVLALAITQGFRVYVTGDVVLDRILTIGSCGGGECSLRPSA